MNLPVRKKSKSQPSTLPAIIPPVSLPAHARTIVSHVPRRDATWGEAVDRWTRAMTSLVVFGPVVAATWFGARA